MIKVGERIPGLGQSTRVRSQDGQETRNSLSLTIITPICQETRYEMVTAARSRGPDPAEARR
jgi:hypothetical protein